MSLSESVLQSQIALNQNHIKYLSLDVENFYYEMAHDIASYKYYSGLKVDKEHAKAIKTSHYKIINAWKREIAKYAKLQKALKAELKGVRQQKAMVRAFLNKKSSAGNIQLCAKESQVFWGEYFA